MATYTSMKATPEAANALRAITLRVSAEVGRRVSSSDALAAVCAVANRHYAEVVAELSTTSGDDQ